MIHIGKPYIINTDTEDRLVCDVEENGDKKQIWFSVEKEYGKYLCYEVADAFLIGLLSYAMRKEKNIESDAPISEILLYNIRENYIPILCKKGNIEKIRIYAQATEPDFEKTGFNGTGLSCGVDSFHTINRLLKSEYSSLNITHFCINNVGAFDESFSGADGGKEQVRSDCYARAKRVADSLGKPIIMTNSNFHEVFPQDHFRTRTFSSMFAVFCLQKLWDRFYYSSHAQDISHFNLDDFVNLPCSEYDLLSASVFSTNKTRIISEGNNLSRVEKIMEIADMKLAQENLHVCSKMSTNCGICPKCLTTQLALEAIGSLDKFGNVFNLNSYYDYKEEYLFYTVQQHLLKENERDAIYDDELFRLVKKAIIKKMICSDFAVLSKVEKGIVFM